MPKRAKLPTVSMEEYRNAEESYLGWCPDCQEFTREETEPDAEEYDCPVCDGRRVMGAEQAMLWGIFAIADDKASARAHAEDLHYRGY